MNLGFEEEEVHQIFSSMIFALIIIAHLELQECKRAHTPFFSIVKGYFVFHGYSVGLFSNFDGM
jgi:hypothetical protein